MGRGQEAVEGTSDPEVSSVIFWGSSERQFASLPTPVQEAFTWAIDQISRNPSALPRTESNLHVETGPLTGSLQLRRIKVTRDSGDSGYRGIYFIDAGTVVFLRFVYRDRATYKGLRASALRARTELGFG